VLDAVAEPDDVAVDVPVTVAELIADDDPVVEAELVADVRVHEPN
jgi:hypothetical protein